MSSTIHIQNFIIRIFQNRIPSSKRIFLCLIKNITSTPIYKFKMDGLLFLTLFVNICSSSAMTAVNFNFFNWQIQFIHFFRFHFFFFNAIYPQGSSSEILLVGWFLTLRFIFIVNALHNFQNIFVCIII